MVIDRTVRISIAAVLLVLSSCSTVEVLAPRTSVVPDGVDFSGTWVVREGPTTGQRRADDTFPNIEAISRGRKGYRTGGTKKSVGSIAVFLRMARTLKVSQTPFGFFISLDRSVVQEFRFGENREVSVGEIVAQRVSGWDNAIYVVETLDKKREKLTERYWLDKNQRLLYREITIRRRNQKPETTLQLFDRSDS